MTKSINKNSNKNVINIKIGETKKKRKRRTKQRKSQREGGYIINNVVQPQIQPQYNAPNYPPEQPIHPAVFHQNRTQSVDMTSQADREGLANKRNAYFNTLFQNPNETQAPNISATNTPDDNNELLKTAFKAIKRDGMLNKRNEFVADTHYENKLKQNTFKNLSENINDSQMNAKADEFRNRYKNKPMTEEKSFTLKDNAFSGLVENNFYEKYIKNFQEAQARNYEFLNKLDKEREKIDEQTNESYENHDMRINDKNANDPANVKYRKSTPLVFKKRDILSSQSPFSPSDEYMDFISSPDDYIDFTETNRDITNPDDFARKHEKKSINKKLVSFFSPNKFADLNMESEGEEHNKPQLTEQIIKNPNKDNDISDEQLQNAIIELKNIPKTNKDKTYEEIKKKRKDIIKLISVASNNEENLNEIRKAQTQLKNELYENSDLAFKDKNYVYTNYENDFKRFDDILNSRGQQIEKEEKDLFLKYMKYFGLYNHGLHGDIINKQMAKGKIKSMKEQHEADVQNLIKTPKKVNKSNNQKQTTQPFNNEVMTLTDLLGIPETPMKQNY